MRIFGSIVLLLLVSCINHDEPQIESAKGEEFQEQIQIDEIKYAKGFSIDYEDGFTKITTHSFGQNEPFRDSIYIKHREVELPEGVQVYDRYLNYLGLQSTTHLSYLKALDLVWMVSGLCGMEYVTDQEILDEMEEMDAQEICLGESMQLEPLLDADVDIILTYPFGSSEQKDYRAKGFQTLMIAEYLEEDQLARLEWIKLFGVLFERPKEANDYFRKVEKDYLALKTEANPDRQFIMNLPWGEQWFMPSSRSVGVQLMEDAGLQYYFRNEEGTENILRSKEQVWQAGSEVPYWIIIASRDEGFSMDDLIAEEAAYSEFKAVKERQVLFCNTATTDYFAKGVVEPNVLLKDLLHHTGQLDDHEPQYFSRLD